VSDSYREHLDRIREQSGEREWIREFTEERDGCTGFVDLVSGVAVLAFDSRGPQPGSPDWPSADAKAAARKEADYQAWLAEQDDAA
jgi:hypothetical protein